MKRPQILGTLNVGLLDIFQCTLLNRHDYQIHALLRWIKLFCDENGNCVINYFVVAPYDKRNSFTVSPAKVSTANSLATYDSKWTYEKIKGENLVNKKKLAEKTRMSVLLFQEL